MRKVNQNSKIFYHNNMNRDQLSKMSKDGFINMLLEQQKGTENTVKPIGTENTVKPVKSLLELAANQSERSIMRPAKLPLPNTSNRVKSLKYLAANATVKDKIKFFGDKPRETKSVITYAKKPVSFADMRHDEFDKTAATRFTPDSSFRNLFNERLKHISGKRENVQITINADVMNIIGNKSTITPETYGPFRIIVPKMDTDDMYKCQPKQ